VATTSLSGGHHILSGGHQIKNIFCSGTSGAPYFSATQSCFILVFASFYFVFAHFYFRFLEMFFSVSTQTKHDYNFGKKLNAGKLE